VEIWEEPARGGHPGPELAGLSGLDLLEAQRARRVFPPPPLSRLTGLKLVEVGLGSVVFEMPLTRWLLSPQGAIPIGLLTLPADGALALAILSTLPAGTAVTTSELSLRVLAPARPEGLVLARGRLLHARRTIALSEVTLTDEHGRVLAHGTSLCFILGHPQAQASPADRVAPADRLAPAASAAPADHEPPEPPPADDAPDPWQRDPIGEVVDQDTWNRLSGLEVVQAAIARELPRPPIHHFIGIDVRAASVGEATFALPATEWLTAPPPGRLQGGVVALLAETALSTAIQTTLPAGTALAPIDVKVNYLRPAVADGRELIADGLVTHRGRRLAVANATVRDADGRQLALATGSAMILPGRAAAL
jgi:uncharacterized protein (TIGR00369 family)